MKTRIEEIYSSYEGKVEEIFINESSYVYEWEKLLMIRKNDGELKKIAVGISGNIRLVNVEVGQEISADTLLVKLEDDLLITGCERCVEITTHLFFFPILQKAHCFFTNLTQPFGILFVEYTVSREEY